MPSRRLLALTAAFVLLNGKSASIRAADTTPAAPKQEVPSPCPLGNMHCPELPLSYAMCRPNAMLDFYDPSLPKDPSLRPQAKTYADARSVQGIGQTRYHLQDDVQLIRADQKLRADSAYYDETSTDYDALGNARIQQAGELLAADHIQGNTQSSRSLAQGHVRYQMLTARGNGTAQRGHMLDAMHSRYDQATYSTCDVGHHTWEFRAKSIATNKDTGRGLAKHGTLYFRNVPLLYLPYFAFPIDNRRQSGVLAPMLGNTGHSGFQMAVPYYFNLAPNYDATLTPRIFTKRGFMLSGEFRYLFHGASGVLDASYTPDDTGGNDGTTNQTKHDQRYLVRFLSQTQLWDGWGLSTNINHASDRSFLRDYGNNLMSGNGFVGSTSTLTSSAYLGKGGRWWNASIGADYYQNENPYVPNTTVSYNRLPRLTFNIDTPINRWLEFGMNNEVVAFRKTDNVEGQREDLYPYLAAYFQGSSWFVKPRIAYRYTAYQLNSGYRNYDAYGRLAANATSPFNRSAMSRALPILSLDAGLVFDRDTHLFGNHYTQTLEPRIYYLYVPYRNQNDLPLFDTNYNTFGYWELFSPNQYSGADRQINANNLTAALTTRFLDDRGVERFSASLGQIQYFSPQKVTLPYRRPTYWSHSDYVAEAELHINDRWRATASYQWNPHIHRTDVGLFELQHRLDNGGLVNFAYRYRRIQPGQTPPVEGNDALLNQYSISGVYPLSDRWRLLGAWTWSQPSHTTIEALGGVEYDSCCIAFRLVDRNYSNMHYYNSANPRDFGHRDNSINFEVIFKGLGTSNDQIEPMLRRDILGYQGYP